MLKFVDYSFKFNPFYNSVEQSESENEREEEGECMREDEGKQISNEDKYISHDDDYINSTHTHLPLYKASPFGGNDAKACVRLYNNSRVRTKHVITRMDSRNAKKSYEKY